jgi:ABC-type antimicrobial peptide transport system permease subunit
MATVVGIPLGLAFTKGMLDTLSSIYGFGNVNIAPNPIFIALLIPLMVLISVLGSYLPGRWAAQSPITNVMQRE